MVDIVLLWCRYYATVDILPPTRRNAENQDKGLKIMVILIKSDSFRVLIIHWVFLFRPNAINALLLCVLTSQNYKW